MKGVLISEIPWKGLRTPRGPSWTTFRELLNKGHTMLYVMEFLGYLLKPSDKTNDEITTVIGFLEMCIC